MARHTITAPYRLNYSIIIIFIIIKSTESSEESRELVVNRGLLEDLLINTIRDMVINQINNILGITTTTTPAPDCGPLGLICP